jgi:DNA-binding GntR family transcriptional regulator
VSESASDAVYRVLFEDIRQQRLLPNASLQEEDLAARFQVSRTPVREAVRRLIQDGLLERRGSSTSVRQLTVEEVANIYPMIAVMEGLAARLAAERISDAELDALHEMHERMAGEADSSPAFIETNQAFHDAIIEAAGNPPLAREIERFRMITNHFRQVVLGMPQRQNQSTAEHAAILEALRSGNGAGAEAAMRNHVGTAEAVLMLLLRTSRLVASSIAQDRSPAVRTQEQRRGSRAPRPSET